MNIAELMVRAGRASPERAAIAVGAKTVMDYGTLSRRVATLGGQFLERYGLNRGDRVVLAMKNCAEYVELLFAIWHVGLVAVPVNARLHAREILYILNNCEAHLCFVTPEMETSISEVSSQAEALKNIISIDSAEYRALLSGEPSPISSCAPEDAGWLFYTSGTTGRPKGVIVTHGNLRAFTVNYLADLDTVDASDSLMHAAPMSHGSGLYVLPHVAKSALNVVPESGRFDPAEICELLNVHNRVTIFAPPTMVRRLLDYPGIGSAHLHNLKTISYGGGPMHLADLEDALAAFRGKLIQTYGQAESPNITCLSRARHGEVEHPHYQQRMATVGTPFTAIELRIADDEDNALPVGAIGEVLARGPTVMRGYWSNAKATAETLRNGWLHTGDLGSVDEEGFLTLKGRSKDVIISGGANIYPREVEDVLLMHSAVHEVSVVGRPHAEWGEEVVAFIVTKPGVTATAAELDEVCLRNIARFKRPRAYRFVDNLPKNHHGKVLKSELRSWLGQALPT